MKFKNIHYLLILIFIIFSFKTNAETKLVFECQKKQLNFEIIEDDIIKVKFNSKEYVAKASKHNTGQKTYEWALVRIPEDILIRYFYIINENRLIALKINLDKEQVNLIIKTSKEDKTGEMMEKLKAKFFYDKYKKNEKIKNLGEVNCKLKK